MSEEPQVPPPADPAVPPPTQHQAEPKPKPPPIPRYRVRRSKTPLPPSIEELAAKGDIEAVLARLRSVYVDCMRPKPLDSLWDCMRTALEAKRLSSLDDLAETLLGIVITSNALLLLRAQITAEGLIAEADRKYKNQIGSLPAEVEQDWLPRLAALQTDLKTSVKALGTFRHIRGLAGKDTAKDVAQEPASEQ